MTSRKELLQGKVTRFISRKRARRGGFGFLSTEGHSKGLFFHVKNGWKLTQHGEFSDVPEGVFPEVGQNVVCEVGPGINGHEFQAIRWAFAPNEEAE